MNLEKVVNNSGFPLQIALENSIGWEQRHNEWNVLYSEHAWSNNNGESGFIDLVLEFSGAAIVLIIECKRVLDTKWVFLNSKGQINKRKHAKTWLSNYVENKFKSFSWIDTTPEPMCPECEYSIVWGQDSKTKPMLERVAASLVSSTEAFAKEEAPLFDKVYQLRLYYNVIVTTAKLNVCTFDPDSISLTDGTLAQAEFTEVPFVRFRKQLQNAPIKDASTGHYFDPRSFAMAKENTVFVVNADNFSAFLKSFDVGRLVGIL